MYSPAIIVVVVRYVGHLFGRRRSKYCCIMSFAVVGGVAVSCLLCVHIVSGCSGQNTSRTSSSISCRLYRYRTNFSVSIRRRYYQVIAVNIGIDDRIERR